MNLRNLLIYISMLGMMFGCASTPPPPTSPTAEFTEEEVQAMVEELENLKEASKQLLADLGFSEEKIAAVVKLNAQIKQDAERFVQVCALAGGNNILVTSEQAIPTNMVRVNAGETPSGLPWYTVKVYRADVVEFSMQFLCLDRPPLPASGLPPAESWSVDDELVSPWDD